MDSLHSIQQHKIKSEQKIFAAQYLRMSTDHQQYSTLNQADKIYEYAEKHNIKIIKTYTDDGKSGLSLNGRSGLLQLIKDVESHQTEFTVILVYDVSRWGRFQDTDESAYYEYICKRAGINIIYCAEQFTNDGTPFTTVMKSFKRTMAGEYSRELSNKVFIGQCRLIELGFRQGGTAGYGLRRALIDPQGNFKTILKKGEHKSFQMDRVILIPGPKEEIKVVLQIYDWFIHENISERQIAHRLNEQNIKTDFDREWTKHTVHEVLTNPKYIGHNIFNRTSNKLKKNHVRNPPEQWIKKDDAFEAIVPVEKFYMAQGMILERSRRYTDHELLDLLRNLFQKHGYLSGLIINESDDNPTTSVYANRFGSLLRAYELIGFNPDRDYQYLEVNKFLRRLHPEITQQVMDEMTKLKAEISKDPSTDLIFINDEISISLVLTRSHQLKSGNFRWKVRFDTTLNPDISVVVRLDQTNTVIKDYFLLPRLDFMQEKISLGEFNPMELDSYRFDNLNFLYGMAERVKWKNTG
ncbi:recombinase family protein [Acinetobacter baumannii]|uniref:recombinase family protein n=1 Tax=Acinetobacter baumannii TaxID=470 RepID=UPI0029350648|nr:recombinase family protein [Acinetobacter baumannii]WOE33930.1 recombinase family protein [Acinetobacter baumannii]